MIKPIPSRSRRAITRGVRYEQRTVEGPLFKAGWQGYCFLLIVGKDKA